MKLRAFGFQTIFARLLLGVVALLLLVLGPLAYYSIEAHRKSLEKHYKEEVRICAASLASALFDSAAARCQPTVQKQVVEVAARSSADVVFVVDASGQVYAHTDISLVGKPFSAGEHERFYFDEEVVIDTEGTPTYGFAHVSIARERLEGEMYSAQTAMAVVFALSLLVAVGLATLFSIHTSRPIRALTLAARTIASGNLDSGIGVIGGPTEIREMAGTFEEMRLSLKENMERLEKSYRELDRKVRDLSILYGISETMNAGDYSEGMLDNILGEALAGLSARLGAVMLRTESEGKTRLVASRGIDPRGENDAHRKLLEAVAFIAMEKEGAAVRQFNDPEPSRPDGGGPLHVLAVPLLVRTDVAGAFVIVRESEPLEKEDAEFIETLASHAARCVERAQLYAASITDGLTKLYVSRYFRMRLNEELRTAARYQRPLSLCMVDIDFFKKVNDNYGHQAGDQVLRVVARCLLDTVRDDVDIAARYGGEEFAIILPETSKEGGQALAERLRLLIERQEIDVGDQAIGVTVSVGVSASPEDGVRPEALVEKADAALYEAKRTGRNRVIVA